MQEKTEGRFKEGEYTTNSKDFEWKCVYSRKKNLIQESEK